MTFIPALWPFVASAAIIGGLMAYAWRFRHTATGQAFLALMAGALVWVVGFTLEIAAVDLEAKLWLARIEFIAITLLPAAWVYLVFAFLGQSRPWREWLLLLLVPVLTNLVIWTNDWHHWFWGRPHIDTTSGPFPVLHADYQFWFYALHAPAGYLTLALALIVLVRGLFRLQPVYRGQGWLLLAAILLPTLTDVLYVLGYSPVAQFNFTTAVFSLSGVILVWALFRFQFLDLLPLARDLVIDNLSDGVIVLDPRGRVVDFNPAAQRLAAPSVLVVGQPLTGLRNDLLDWIGSMLRRGETQADVGLGETRQRHFDLRLAPIAGRRGDQLGSVVTIRDITERVQLFRQVQALATQDSLTGIANRRHFIDVCRQELVRLQRQPRRRAALIMIDLDHFKTINDGHGHAAGDEVLVAFAKSVALRLRAADVFGRLGGEEFAVFLPDVGTAEAAGVAERLRATVEALRVSHAGHDLSITASLGVAWALQLAPEASAIETLLNLADQALYQAKQAGRNGVAVREAPSPAAPPTIPLTQRQQDR